MFKLKKISLSILVVLALVLCSSAYAFADNTTTGTWYPGVAPTDPVPSFNGGIIYSNGDTKILTTSPFNGHNIITEEQVEKMNSPMNNQTVTPNYWDGDYYYEYISNSFTPTSTFSDAYHYNTGHTQAFNAGDLPLTLQYNQGSVITSQWTVTDQVMNTVGLKSEYFSVLSRSFGKTYTTSTTTQSSTQIICSMQIPVGKTGYINAYLPAAYTYGKALYKEYYYNKYTATFISTGNTVYTYEGGYSPLDNSSIYALNFWSYTD